MKATPEVTNPISEDTKASEPALRTFDGSDELGAHVSVAGGPEKAPGRASEIGAVVLQMFTKAPSRWDDPAWPEGTGVRFRAEAARAGVVFAATHDSYLINMASPDPVLRHRSMVAFRRELERAGRLGLDAVVTHPGNATDGDKASGVERNAEAVAEAMEEAGNGGADAGAGGANPGGPGGRTADGTDPGGPRVLLELTAGAGTSVGGTFEELAAIIRRVPEPWRRRVGICFDTCHAWVGGYDLVADFDGVVARMDDAFGADLIGLFHLNDAKTPFGSRRDRHEHIGQGSMGKEPFRRLLNSDRFRHVPKVLETPKGQNATKSDRANLAVLRGMRPGP